MSKRSQFRSFQKYAVFYGQGEEQRLSRFDVVVVEPAHRSEQEVRFLQENDTLVLAYVSVMEIHPAHPLVQELTPGDYLVSDKPPYEPLSQADYGSRLLDLTSVHWRGILMRHIGQLLTKDGYDGILMDTIGDVEMPTLPSPSLQVDAAIQFVKQLRRWFPDAIIVQNNGLELLCLQTAPDIDALVWENPPLWQPDSRHWVQAVADRLKQLREDYNLRILALFEGARQDKRNDWIRGRRFADEHGFVSYFSPIHYLTFNT